MANPILNAWKNAMKSTKENMSGFDEFKGYSGTDDIPADIGESEELSPREFARVFDPTSDSDVMKMQGMLGVKEDGILGPKTLKSLRALQGVPYDSPEVGFSEESQWADESGYGDKFGVMEDEYGDMVSYGAPASSVNMDKGFADTESWIRDRDASYLTPNDEDTYSNPEFQGPTKDEVDFQAEEQDFLKTAMARTLKNEETPYTPDEYSEMDRYDEEGNIIGGPDYKGPGSTNMTRFNQLARALNPDLGSFLQIDRGSLPGKAYSGVNFPDNRFMQSPRESRGKLSDFIMRNLNVSKNR